LGQRSRKRGRRDKPPQRPQPPVSEVGDAPTATRKPARPPAGRSAGHGRSDDRNAAVRAALRPLAPGERPLAITISAGITAALGAGNLIAFLVGAKIGGKHPAATGIILFTFVMFMCSIGLWRMWYGAVLGFMVILAIVICLFALLLVEASNLLGFVVPPLIIAGAGYLFMKLVRTLSRIQMPKYPSR
jgi:hypothetical protein